MEGTIFLILNLSKIVYGITSMILLSLKLDHLLLNMYMVKKILKVFTLFYDLFPINKAIKIKENK